MRGVHQQTNTNKHKQTQSNTMSVCELCTQTCGDRVPTNPYYMIPVSLNIMFKCCHHCLVQLETSLEKSVLTMNANIPMVCTTCIRWFPNVYNWKVYHGEHVSNCYTCAPCTHHLRELHIEKIILARIAKQQQQAKYKHEKGK